MVMVTEGSPVSAFPSCRRTEVVLYTYSKVILNVPEVHCLAYRPGNACGIIAVSCVPIASIEHPDSLTILNRKTSKEPDESNFIVNLANISW